MVEYLKASFTIQVIAYTYGVRCMDIGFIWDIDKYQEVQRKHNVQFYEVVSAFDDPGGYDDPDPQGHSDRWMFIGKSVTNRILVIIYIPEDAEIHRLITAYEASQEIRNGYYRRSRI